MWADNQALKLQRRAHIIWENEGPQNVFIVKKTGSAKTTAKLREIALWQVTKALQQQPYSLVYLVLCTLHWRPLSNALAACMNACVHNCWVVDPAGKAKFVQWIECPLQKNGHPKSSHKPHIHLHEFCWVPELAHEPEFLDGNGCRLQKNFTSSLVKKAELFNGFNAGCKKEASESW